MINRIIGVFALFAFTLPVFADRWDVKSAPPGIGTKWEATVTNDTGDTLRVWRKIGRSGYEAFAELTLGKGKFGDTMPVYRIDSMPTEDTTVIKRAGDNLGRDWGKIEENKATWRVWTSTETIIRPNDALAPWIKGNQIYVSYIDDTGSKKKSTFSLSGSATAINTAIKSPFK